MNYLEKHYAHKMQLELIIKALIRVKELAQYVNELKYNYKVMSFPIYVDIGFGSTINLKKCKILKGSLSLDGT